MESSCCYILIHQNETTLYVIIIPFKEHVSHRLVKNELNKCGCDFLTKVYINGFYRLVKRKSPYKSKVSK